MLGTMQQNSQNDRFLIDGFPRNQDNLTGWNKQMADKVDLQCVLFFDCDEQVCSTYTGPCGENTRVC